MDRYSIPSYRIYTKGQDSDLNNLSGAGFTVPTQNDRAYAYQHFTLGLLESKKLRGMALVQVSG